MYYQWDTVKFNNNNNLINVFNFTFYNLQTTHLFKEIKFESQWHLSQNIFF